MEGHGISPLQCWNLLGIYRLAARIYDLRQDGWCIESKKLTVKNRYGEDVVVNEYRLVSSYERWCQRMQRTKGGE